MTKAIDSSRKPPNDNDGTSGIGTTSPALLPRRQIRILTLLIIWLSLMFTLAGCATKRPVLYPNYQLVMVGHEEAEIDIEDCMQLARDYGADASKSGKIAKDTATGAAVGGATGAAVGAVVNDFGTGAAAGAAGGAAGALTRSVIRSGNPDPVFRRFVEKCLRDKGYAPIGWR